MFTLVVAWGVFIVLSIILSATVIHSTIASDMAINFVPFVIAFGMWFASGYYIFEY